MTDSERRQNPFDKPKQKATDPSVNANKKKQMQKIDDFRDQLNKQLFGESNTTNDSNDANQVFGTQTASNATNNDNENVKKEYKVPPKAKRPEIKVDTGDTITKPDKTNNTDDNNIKNNKINDKSKQTSDKSLKEHQTVESEVKGLKGNVSFSEENCVSVKLENNNSDSSNEKNKVNNCISDVIKINSPLKEILNQESKEEEIIINNSSDSDVLTKNINTGNFNITSSELSKKLDKLKTEIKELKQSKSTLDTNFHIEVNKNKLFENEIDDLRKTLHNFKIKEISEGEAMLKLEIENYKSTVEYKNKENCLLRKENESLVKEVNKLQNYFKRLFDKNANTDDADIDFNNNDDVVDNVDIDANNYEDKEYDQDQINYNNSHEEIDLNSKNRQEKNEIGNSFYNNNNVQEEENDNENENNYEVNQYKEGNENEDNEEGEEGEETYLVNVVEETVANEELKENIENENIEIKNDSHDKDEIHTDTIVDDKNNKDRTEEEPEKIEDTLFENIERKRERERERETNMFRDNTIHQDNIFKDEGTVGVTKNSPEKEKLTELFGSKSNDTSFTKKTNLSKNHQEEVTEFPKNNLPEKIEQPQTNIFNEITDDVEDIFSLKSQTNIPQKQVPVKQNKVIITPLLIPTKTKNKESLTSQNNTSFTKKENETKKFNVFALDLNDEDIGNVFSNIGNKNSSAGNNLFD